MELSTTVPVLSDHELEMLTRRKWAYAAEAAGFDRTTARRLTFAKYLVITGGLTDFPAPEPRPCTCCRHTPAELERIRCECREGYLCRDCERCPEHGVPADLRHVA